MAKKIRLFLFLTLFIVMVFSSFSLGLTFSIYEGSIEEFKDRLRYIPFNPIFEIRLSSKAAIEWENIYRKYASNPKNIILNTAHEEKFSQVMVDTSKYTEKEMSNYIPFTRDDVNLLKNSPYIIDAFLSNGLDQTFNQYLFFENKQIQLFPLPIKFMKNLGVDVKWGKFPDKSDPLNIVILPYELSEKLFGKINPVGKEVKGINNKGEETTYRIIGVLEPLPNDCRSLFFFDSFAFTILPEDYKPEWSKIFVYADVENTIYAISTKENYKKALNFINKVSKDKGNKTFLFPHIETTYTQAYRLVGMSLIKHRIKYIAIGIIFVFLVSLLVLSSFVMLNLIDRKYEISVKRCLGIPKRVLYIEEYKRYLTFSLLASLSSLILILLVSPYIEKLNILNFLGESFSFHAPSEELFRPRSLYIGPLTMLAVFLTPSFSVAISLFLVIKKFTKSPPVWGLRGNVSTEINPSLKQLLHLIIIIMLAITGSFCFLSIRSTILKGMRETEKEVSTSVIRIVPPLIDPSQNLITTPIYTYKDYKLVKSLIGERGFVGFRNEVPQSEPVTIDNREKILIRISQATEDFPQIYDFKLKKGRFLHDGEEGVCVVGERVSETLKLNIGDYYLDRSKRYKVVGIIEHSNKLIDRTIFIPNSRIVEWQHNRPHFLVKAKNPEETESLAKEILNYLNSLHPDKDPGVILDVKEKVEEYKRFSTSTYTLLSIFFILSLIASFISLSAMLLIDILKKIREIGIKRAIGATKRDIVREYTLRGLRITILSLLISIPLGIIISIFVDIIKGWSIYIPVETIIIIVSVSLFLGFILSFIPSLFASNINPGEAIKTE